MLSMRKRIEDSIVRAEMVAPIALELEEAKHVNQEEPLQLDELWDDLGKANEILVELAHTAKVVDTVRDLKYKRTWSVGNVKAEEAKLITELAEIDSIDYELFKQAYSASVDLNKFLDKYEMSKHLSEPYDMEGACISIESKCGDANSERWAELLAQMYTKWAEKQGSHTSRIVEVSPDSGGLKSATIEFEFKFAYGYLSGERGIHAMTRNAESKDVLLETSSVSVDVFPLFMESSSDLSIDDRDILVSYPSDCHNQASSAVQIQHVPMGLTVQSTGERSRFANKIKALNRMKLKLLVILRDLGLSSLKSFEKDDVRRDTRIEETCRRYMFGTTGMVHDLKSGMQIPDVTGVLNGNLDPLTQPTSIPGQTSLMFHRSPPQESFSCIGF